MKLQYINATLSLIPLSVISISNGVAQAHPEHRHTVRSITWCRDGIPACVADPNIPHQHYIDLIVVKGR